MRRRFQCSALSTVSVLWFFLNCSSIATKSLPRRFFFARVCLAHLVCARVRFFCQCLWQSSSSPHSLFIATSYGVLTLDVDPSGYGQRHVDPLLFCPFQSVQLRLKIRVNPKRRVMVLRTICAARISNEFIFI